MMDDGYWEALLRDVESEAAAPRPTDGEEDLSAAGVTLPTQEWRPRPMASTTGAAFDDEEADWARAQTLLEAADPLNLAITGYNRGGLLADFGCIQGFAPASHLLAPPAAQDPAARMAALAARVGETLELRVIEIDRERRRLILSERCAQTDNQAEELLANLRPGQVCHGAVTNLCAFGAFVDLGGYEGLIHISELSWGRINTADEIVQPGEAVEVMVLEVNSQAQKIALSLKRLRPDPWAGVESRYYPGQVIEAVITNVVNFGAFARLEEGLEGLIHISELAEGSFMHPRNIVNEGDRVRVRVLHVDGPHHRLALTMRSADVAGRDRSAAAAAAAAQIPA
jgi:small subunit ribosomal protein S1